MQPVTTFSDWVFDLLLLLALCAGLWFFLRKRRRLRWLPVILFWLVMSVVVGVLGFRLGRTMLRQAAMNSALDTWQAEAPANYALTIERQLDGESACQRTFVVRADRVEGVQDDTCGSAWTDAAVTVDTLFGWVEDDLRTKTCGPNGCVCDGVIVLDVSYNDEWGYPDSLSFRLHPSDRWLYPEDWLTFDTGCGAAPWDDQTLTVTALTPLE